MATSNSFDNLSWRKPKEYGQTTQDQFPETQEDTVSSHADDPFEEPEFISDSAIEGIWSDSNRKQEKFHKEQLAEHNLTRRALFKTVQENSEEIKRMIRIQGAQEDLFRSQTAQIIGAMARETSALRQTVIARSTNQANTSMQQTMMIQTMQTLLSTGNELMMDTNQLVRTERSTSVIIPKSMIRDHLVPGDIALLAQLPTPKIAKPLPTTPHQKKGEAPPHNKTNESHYEDMTMMDLQQQPLKGTQEQTQEATGKPNKKKNTPTTTTKAIRVTEAPKKKTPKNLEITQEFIPQHQPEYLHLGRGRPPQTHNTYRSVFT